MGADRVAILGYGRFGEALGRVITDSGGRFRALDPHVAIPPEVFAGSLEELSRDAEVVVLAVPIPRLRSALSALVPHLTPAQLVIDVGSVKVLPETVMGDVLRDGVPWVATHPLFGPTSLALGEGPFNVIICPRPDAKEAIPRARAFWESLGCVVIEQDARSHDRSMAETHALTYFIAHGLIDMRAGDGISYTPPSFRALQRTVDRVRSDAGHLFGAIHRENPFSADARGRFLEALERLNAAIEDDGAAKNDEDRETLVEERLAMPAAPPVSGKLKETRRLIDEVDRQLVGLFARRAQLARRAREAKAEVGREVRDPTREAQVLEDRRRWARESGLDQDRIEEIFRSILRFSRSVQTTE